MDRMSRARARHRQWRESMTYSQRQEYLARRREQARGKRPVVEIDHDYQSQFDQVLEGENVHQCEELGPSGTSQPAPYHSENLHFSRSLHVDNDGPQYSRRRLTHVRQLARMDRSQISEDVQNFPLHGECIRGVHDLPMLNHGQTGNSNMSLNIGEDMTINDVRMNVNEEDHDMENVFTPVAPVHGVQQQRRIRRPRTIHNSARDFNEDMGIPYCELPPVRRCPYCQAMLFHQETFSLCCCKGNIVLPLIQSPPEMVRLFSDQTNEGRKFRQSIRAYNNVFAFTSMSVHVDESINVRSHYTFRAQGSIYHKIGSLLPIDGRRPRYLQAYIYDTEHELQNRLSKSEVLDRETVEKIQQILHQYNPFVEVLRSLGQCQDLPNCRLIIREQPFDRRQYNMPSASQVAAVIVGGEDNINPDGRDFIVQTVDGRLWNIKDSVGYYDPMQYPLLLPYGSYGWDIKTRDNRGNDMSCCDFYAYMLQVRQGHENLLHRGGRLLQQYVVDNYVKIESQRLRYLRLEQEKFRKEFRQGLQDSLHAGEHNAENVGRRTILPSSFIGSPRDMHQRYQDAMALVQKFGRPDLFITMTCNPNWEEIKTQLLPGQTPKDRPDIVTRVFHAKLGHFKEDIVDKGVLGKVVAHAFVIEFQKRGLPHVHMLVMLAEGDKLNNPDEYDRIVRAEIPNKDDEPQLYEAVCTHMIHGPCGILNPRLACMKNGSCNKGYPKSFSNFTMQGNAAYPVYRRRESRLPVHTGRRGDVMVDNSWVVPYNPWLLLRYNCHINVKICGSIKSVKYLYKYVYKGPDIVALQLQSNPDFDEIKQYVDARWVCAPEALWRIFKFGMNRIYPTVERLQIHLPNMQQITFREDEVLEDILADEQAQKTMLTEFFTLNRVDEDAKEYLYREIPEHYRWDSSRKFWAKRRNKYKVIGRIYSVSPLDSEKFNLRVLLNHIRGPTSFRDVLTVDGVLQPTFKQVAEMRGFLENDSSIRNCLLEASTVRMPSALRRLFVTILIFSEPTGVRMLWDEFYPFMVEDYPSCSETRQINRLLRDLNSILEQFDKSIKDFDLPDLINDADENPAMPRCIEDELLIEVPQEDVDAIGLLNNDQKSAFNTIMAVVERQESGLFFVDDPGGTGKTFLYRALLASLRSKNHIVLATTSSGIAANILPGGRTAHSRFKLPLIVDASADCCISKQSALAQLIRSATAIIWDEAPMTHRYNFELLDRTFRDILASELPFGRKIMIFGGDFRQVHPVILKGTKSELIQASIMRSTFWAQVKILRLRENMRSINDRHFAEFLLRVGDGAENVYDDKMIKLPDSMVVPWENDSSIQKIIDEVFPNLGNHVNDARYMVERTLITPINDDVDMLNDKIIDMFPGDRITLYSFDYVEDDTRNLYQSEFLNSLSVGGLPPHKLTLKVGAPVMLLRNIDPKLGLCNGTRLLCRGFYQNLIDAQILTGHCAGTRVFLPRIPLKTVENAGLPFSLTRKQFPIKLSFSLTINKSQGQTIPHIGVYLPNHVFSHGQLYVALSRGVSETTTKVLIKRWSITGEDGAFTKNVVFKEVLLPPDSNDI